MEFRIAPMLTSADHIYVPYVPWWYILGTLGKFVVLNGLWAIIIIDD